MRRDRPGLRKRSTCLYRMYNAQGRLLYVGVSCNPFCRTAYHNGKSKWETDVRFMTFQHFPDRATALAAERKAVREENPIHNVPSAQRVPLHEAAL